MSLCHRLADDYYATGTLNAPLAVIALAQLMVVLDSAIGNVALPSIQRELHRPGVGRHTYTIGFGGLLLLGGRTCELVATDGGTP